MDSWKSLLVTGCSFLVASFLTFVAVVQECLTGFYFMNPCIEYYPLRAYTLDMLAPAASFLLLAFYLRWLEGKRVIAI